MADAFEPTVGYPGASESAGNLPDRIARYTVEDELARGGIGIVLRCRDEDVGRELAVKTLRPEFADHSEYGERFFEEARITGRLQHPGIPPVHELGKMPDGRPFYAMKLIRGETLAERIQAGDMQTPEKLDIFEGICQTLAYAHSRMVIHRDLKPLNVMVGAFGEVQVMDWGMAKQLGAVSVGNGETLPSATASDDVAETIITTGEDDTAEFLAAGDSTQRTRAGQVMGTPAYMPTEQARGEIAKIDRRSDVFGLGAILCELLTDRPPYAGEKVFEQAIHGATDDAFSDLDACGADGELIALTKSCLQADAELRPEHAGIVADAVRGYREAVQDRLREAEVTAAAREAKSREQRKRFWTIGIAAAVFLVASGAAAIWFVQDRADRRENEFQNQLAEENRKSSIEGALSGVLSDGERLSTALITDLRDLDKFRNYESDATDWERRLQELDGVLKRARGLEKQAKADTGLDSRLEARLAALSKTIDTHHRDKKFHAEVEKIILRMFVGTKNADEQRRLVGHAMIDSLRTYGVDILDVAALKTALPRINIPWSVVHGIGYVIATQGVEDKLANRIVDVLNEFDSNEWRSRARKQMLGISAGEIAWLADHASAPDQPVHLLNFVATESHALNPALRKRLLRLVRAAGMKYPKDFWLAIIESRHGSVHEKLAADRVAVALRPEFALVYYNLGTDYGDLGDHENALNYLLYSHKLDPTNSHTANNIGSVYLDIGEFKKAEVWYRKSVDLEETDVNYGGLGKALVLQKRFPEAYAAMKKSWQLKKTFLTTHDLGSVSLELRKVAEAEKLYREAIKLDPHSGLGVVSLAKLLSGARRFEEADRLLIEFINDHPKDFMARKRLAATLLQRNRPVEAYPHFQAAIRNNPKDVELLYNFAFCNERMRKTDDAAEFYVRALQVDPRYFNALINMGFLMSGAKKYEKAVGYHRRAAQAQPKSGQGWGALALTLHKAGRFIEAKAAAKQSLDFSGTDKRGAAIMRSKIAILEPSAKKEQQILDALSNPEKASEGKDLLSLAGFAVSKCRMYAAAAELCQRAFEKSPELVNDASQPWRFNASVASIAASFGLGRDSSRWNLEARKKWRNQALSWLEADLTGLEEAAKADATRKPRIKQTLAQWMKMPPFAGVRELSNLARLTTAEQFAWQRFWRRVRKLYSSL